MSKVGVTILESNFEVEFDFKITVHSFGGSGPSWSSPGEPPEPCEYDLEILALYKKDQKEELELTPWLKELLLDFLYGSDEVYEIVAESEYDGGWDDGEG